MSGNFIAVGTVNPAIEIRLCYFMLFCFKNIYVLLLDFYLIQEGDELRPHVVLGARQDHIGSSHFSFLFSEL